ncbi:MAG: extracellular solute-binding protein, partial [Micrococcales bacterium]|nr:extracellular solute-binding protein [Micrococcales bacterium]
MAIVAFLATGMVAVAGCAGGGWGSGPDDQTEMNQNEISVLIGSSGPAETDAVRAAVAAWSQKTGIPAVVNPASDLAQQAAQGFAGGRPDDILYVSTEQLPGWAQNGSLQPYGDQLTNKEDFFPALVDAFTYNDKFFCAPKDFSTLALAINTDMWEAAGLTEADYPKTWDDLEKVATALTTGDVMGLVLAPEIQRLGVFMAQAGGGLLSADGQAQADAPANVEALNFVKRLLNSGVAAYVGDVGAGWGGEALGRGLGAMVIEGNWIEGAMSADFPSTPYKVVELPAGLQKGTLQFTNCWGLATDGRNKLAAVDLIEFLTSTEQQIAFAKAFGVMPSVVSAADQFRQDFPAKAAFIDSAE